MRHHPAGPDATDIGWPVTPDGLRALLVSLRDAYPDLPPVSITENGVAYDDPPVGTDGRIADARPHPVPRCSSPGGPRGHRGGRARARLLRLVACWTTSSGRAGYSTRFGIGPPRLPRRSDERRATARAGPRRHRAQRAPREQRHGRRAGCLTADRRKRGAVGLAPTPTPPGSTQGALSRPRPRPKKPIACREHAGLPRVPRSPCQQGQVDGGRSHHEDVSAGLDDEPPVDAGECQLLDGQPERSPRRRSPAGNADAHEATQLLDGPGHAGLHVSHVELDGPRYRRARR